MEDLSMSFVRSIIALLVCSALIGVFYVFVIQNYMDFDLSGYSIQQEKSGVYQHGYTLEEATGDNLQGRIFTPAHIVMFPAVDSHVEFNSQTAGRRYLRIYDKMRLKHDTAVPFSNSPVWVRTYDISLQSVSNRSAIYRQFAVPLPEDNPSNLSWSDLVSLSQGGSAPAGTLAHPTGAWYGVVNGSHDGSSDWLFYKQEQAERLLVRLTP